MQSIPKKVHPHNEDLEREIIAYLVRDLNEGLALDLHHKRLVQKPVDELLETEFIRVGQTFFSNERFVLAFISVQWK